MFTALKNKLTSLKKKHKILFVSLVFFIIFGLLFVLFAKPEKEKELVKPQLPTAPKQQAPQSIPQLVLDKLSQFMGTTKKVEIKTVEETTPISTPVITESIIKQVLNYIKNQYRNDGFYDYVSHYDELCFIEGNEEKCPFGGERMFETTNAWTTLAYLSAYQVFNDDSYLNLARRDLDKLMQYCQDKPKACLYVLVQFEKAYAATRDQKYLSFLQNAGQLLLTTSDPDPMLQDIEIRQLAVLYRLTNEDKYLQEANRRLLEAQNTWQERPVLYYITSSGEKVPVPKTLCWNALAQLELYIATGDNKYLQSVQALFKQSDIPNLFSLFEHPYQIEPCIESYFELSKITDYNLYKKEGGKLLDQFIEKYWDSKEKKLLYGEGGIIYYPYFTDETPKTKKITILSDTCHFLYLLSKAGN